MVGRVSAESDCEDEELEEEEEGRQEGGKDEGSLPQGGSLGRDAQGCCFSHGCADLHCVEIDDEDDDGSPYAADSDDAATQFHQHYVAPPRGAASLGPVVEDDDDDEEGGECADADVCGGACERDDEEGLAVGLVWGEADDGGARCRSGMQEPHLGGEGKGIERLVGDQLCVAGDEDVSSSLQSPSPHPRALVFASEEEEGQVHPQEGCGATERHETQLGATVSFPPGKSLGPAGGAAMAPRDPSQAAARSAGLSLDQRFATFPTHREAWAQHEQRLEGAGLLLPCETPGERSARKARFPGLGPDFDPGASGRVGSRQCTSCSKQVGGVGHRCSGWPAYRG